jgi:hypothetical protein
MHLNPPKLLITGPTDRKVVINEHFWRASLDKASRRGPSTRKT